MDDKKWVKAYKGFNRDMTCRGFKFEEGKEYHEDRAKLCDCGFHACEVPMDVFSHYAPGTSVYHEVEIAGDTGERESIDSKISGTDIRIGAKLDIAGLIRAQIEFIKSNFERAAQGDGGHAAAQGNRGHAAAQGNWGHAAAQGYSGHAAAQGNWGHAAAQGDGGHAAAQGDWGHAAAQGNRGHAAAQGDGGHAAAQGDGGHAAAQGNWGHAAAQGDWGHAAAQGDWGHAAAQGYSGHAAAQGDWGHAAAQGDWGHAAAQGYGGHAEVHGKDAIAAAFGIDGRAKGEIGDWLVLAEWENTDTWHIKTVKTALVDGEKIKADTWYKLQDGEFVEAEEE